MDATKIRQIVNSDLFSTLLQGAVVLGLLALMAMVMEQQKRIEALELRPPITSYVKKPCGCNEVSEIAKASAEVKDERSERPSGSDVTSSPGPSDSGE